MRQSGAKGALIWCIFDATDWDLEEIKSGMLKIRRAANFAAPKTWWRPSNHYP